jgi:hypothetical protein
MFPPELDQMVIDWYKKRLRREIFKAKVNDLEEILMFPSKIIDSQHLYHNSMVPIRTWYMFRIVGIYDYSIDWIIHYQSGQLESKHVLTSFAAR